MNVTDANGLEGRTEVTIPGRTLDVHPDIARPRTAVTVSGRNFVAANPDGSSVAVALTYGCGGNVRRTVLTEPDASGNFYENLRVPDDCLIPSSNVITATVLIDGSETIAETVTHEIPEAEIMVTPDRATTGQTITVTGRGFRTFEGVESIELGPRNILGGREEYTDRDGRISIAGLTVPDITPGAYSLVMKVGEGPGQTSASATFEVVAEALPADGSGQTFTGESPVSGEWAEGCNSEDRPGSYARFYAFSLAQSSEVTVTLESSDADTFLYLREGEVRAGDFLHENDDHEGNTSISQIQETLAAGTYTVEATTYDPEETGSFTLTINGIEARAAPLPTDNCVQDLGILGRGNVATRTGTWTGDCYSANQDGSYARFYTLTLEHQRGVQIDLTSAQDTYLFLLRGAGIGGQVMAENDDVDEGTDTNSRISANLSPRKYTIEATTYTAGITGDFRVTLLLPPGPVPTPPATDDCVDDLGVLAWMSVTTRNGTWTGICDSTTREGSHARFFSFILEREMEVLINLHSTQDTYLYLLQGAGTHGTVMVENDDVAQGIDTNSRIGVVLEPGAYTIEATTYNAGVTGEFKLFVFSLRPPSTAGCIKDLGPLMDGVTRDGNWTGTSDSTNREGSYARFYSFTLEQETDVRIDLSSPEDTYLYLLQGAGADGEVVAENDDVVPGTDTNSRLSETLPPGAYTIEAATYHAGAVGRFTLVIVPGRAQDREVLVTFYHATGGDDWLRNDNWLSDASLRQWHGVTTDHSGRVTGLDLHENQLDGEIPAELGHLANLEKLYLSDNHLTGPVPPELGDLANLAFLDLSDNKLSGEIPPQLGNLASLTWLGLNYNQFSAGIPPELGNLTSLESLWLHGNELSGTIPASLSGLTELKRMCLYDNQLSGQIPEELDELTNLIAWRLRSNTSPGAYRCGWRLWVTVTLTNSA